MKKYRIEIQEIEDDELKDIREIFSSYKCIIYEDKQAPFEIIMKGVNAWIGLPAILRVLSEKLSGDNNEEDL